MRFRRPRAIAEPDLDDALDDEIRRAVVDGLRDEVPLREVLVSIVEHTAARLGPCRLWFHGWALRAEDASAGEGSFSGRATVIEEIGAGPVSVTLAVWLPPTSAASDHHHRLISQARDLAQLALLVEEARCSRWIPPDTDPLTGSMNRNAARAYLAGARAQGWVGPHAVLAVDLDDLKRVGNRYGHAGGDRVLIGAADRLRRTVGPAGVVARTGGDEFVAVCLGLAADRADSLAEEMRAALAEPHRFPTGDDVCTATVGVAVTDDAADLPALVDRAFDAVQVGKAVGRNRVERWDATMPPG